MRYLPLLYFIVHSLTAQATYLIHNKKIADKHATYVKLDNQTHKHIDVTYTPQQVVRVRNEAKKVPIYANRNGMQYVKYIVHHPKTQQAKAGELLVRTEPIGKVKNLLDETHKGAFKDHVVRIYQKIDNKQLDKQLWKPLLTAPLDLFKKQIQANIAISPEGSIYLSNT